MPKAVKTDPVDAPPTDRRGALANLTPAWKPGQSGNPGGKSKTEAQIAMLCREHSPEMVRLLMDIARSNRQAGTARVMAMQELFNRGFGKAPQRVLLQTDTGGMDNTELQAFIQRELVQAARTIDGEAEEVEE